jgi:hypothetical protein
MVEEERTAMLEESEGMEFKVVEATMAKRERWEGRIRTVENRGEAAIAVAVAVRGNAMLAWDRYEAVITVIVGDREREGGKGTCHRDQDLEREQDGLAAKELLLRINATEMAGKHAREQCQLAGQQAGKGPV